MELFATDLERLGFLAQGETELRLAVSGEFVPGVSLAEAPETDARHGNQKPADRPKYITNYIGSKQKLVDWIWRNTPQDVKSVVDVSSGSAVVAYMFKTKGLRVIANDRLHYCHHAARAIIESSKERLGTEDIDKLLAENGSAGSFVRDNFKVFFAQGVHGLIDQVRPNCDKFSGYKMHIALFALGKTCMSAHGGFGHFSAALKHGRRTAQRNSRSGCARMSSG